MSYDEWYSIMISKSYFYKTSNMNLSKNSNLSLLLYVSCIFLSKSQQTFLSVKFTENYYIIHQNNCFVLWQISASSLNHFEGLFINKKRQPTMLWKACCMSLLFDVTWWWQTCIMDAKKSNFTSIKQKKYCPQSYSELIK